MEMEMEGWLMKWNECCNCFHVCTYSESCTVQFGIYRPRTVRCPLYWICRVCWHLCICAGRLKKLKKLKKIKNLCWLQQIDPGSQILVPGSMTRRALWHVNTQVHWMFNVLVHQSIHLTQYHMIHYIVIGNMMIFEITIKMHLGKHHAPSELIYRNKYKYSLKRNGYSKVCLVLDAKIKML